MAENYHSWMQKDRIEVWQNQIKCDVIVTNGQQHQQQQQKHL